MAAAGAAVCPTGHGGGLVLHSSSITDQRDQWGQQPLEAREPSSDLSKARVNQKVLIPTELMTNMSNTFHEHSTGLPGGPDAARPVSGLKPCPGLALWSAPFASRAAASLPFLVHWGTWLTGLKGAI